MALGVIVSLLAGVVPMVIYALVLSWFDRYEKEPPLLMIGVFLWGAIVAAGAALIINTVFGVGVYLLTGSEGAASFGAAVFSAPLVEEVVKGLAVLGVFLFFRHEFDSLLDGILYGSLVGFGFAAAENVNYIFTGYVDGGWSGLMANAFIRTVVIAFLHATLTACTGIGFAVARLNRGWLRYTAPVLGLAAAIFLHALHNVLASLGLPLVCVLGSLLDWAGFLGMFGLILYLVWREGRIVRHELAEEVALGTLTPAQAATAGSLSGQLAARWSGLLGGNLRLGRLYDLCGELAFKKYQLSRVGHEAGLAGRIERLRGEIGALSRGSIWHVQ